MHLDTIGKVLWRLATRAGTILCFHSVTSRNVPGEGFVHVPAPFFERLVEMVNRVGHVAPLTDLLKRHRRGKSTKGMFALTFDDAYAAVASEGAPVISRLRLPVTVFVCSTAAMTGARFWWDRVDDLHPKVSPVRWRAFEDEIGLPDAYRQGQPADLGPLRPLRQWVLAVFAGRWPPRLEEPLAALEREVGFTTRHRSMVWDELRDFLVTCDAQLGNHTASHVVLPMLSADDIRSEIRECREALEERFPGRTVPVLAFPFGLFDERSVRHAQEAGMRETLSVTEGAIRAESLPLRRILLRRSDTVGRVLARASRLRDLVKSRESAGYPALPSPNS